MEESITMTSEESFRQCVTIQFQYCDHCKSWSGFKRSSFKFKHLFLLHMDLKSYHHQQEISLNDLLQNCWNHSFFPKFKPFWHDDKCTSKSLRKVIFFQGATKSIEFQVRNNSNKLLKLDLQSFEVATFSLQNDSLVQEGELNVVLKQLILRNLKDQSYATVDLIKMVVCKTKKQGIKFNTFSDLVLHLHQTNFSLSDTNLIVKPVFIRFINLDSFTQPKFWKVKNNPPSVLELSKKPNLAMV